MTAQAAAQTQTGRTCGECRAERSTEVPAGGAAWTEIVALCPLHAQAEALLAALSSLMRCADWDGGDIASLNITELQAALPQAREAIAAAKGGAGDASPKGLKALLGDALERDSGSDLGDLPMDLEKDEGDGGLGSGRWMDEP